jgi:phage baseplate assembly protein gpV
MTRIQLSNGLMVVVAALTLTACTPTVQVAAPKEPITINLNVKIEHEIYVRVDKALDDVISESSGLF